MRTLHRNYIEINLLTHCTLRCENCAVASPLLKPAVYAFEDFKKDITELAKVVHFKDIRFLGGGLIHVGNLRY